MEQLPEKTMDETILITLMPPGSSKTDLRLFAEHCSRTKLDPFSRQIYPMKRYDSAKRMEVISFQVSIDGFRVIAERSGHYNGQDGPYWCGKDGVWKDVWLESEPPSAAKVGVLRDDFKQPIFSVAKFDEYKQTTKEGSLVSMWKKMGANQLAKCAEALALRRAFPNDLSGLYTTEEMAQATPVVEETKPIENTAVKASKNPTTNELLLEMGAPAVTLDFSSTQIEEERAPVEQPKATPKPTERSAATLGNSIGKEPLTQEQKDVEAKVACLKLVNEGVISLDKPQKTHLAAIMGIYNVPRDQIVNKCRTYMAHHFGGKQKWDELTPEEQQRTIKDAAEGLLVEPCLL